MPDPPLEVGVRVGLDEGVNGSDDALAVPVPVAAVSAPESARPLDREGGRRWDSHDGGAGVGRGGRGGDGGRGDDRGREGGVAPDARNVCIKFR